MNIRFLRQKTLDSVVLAAVCAAPLWFSGAVVANDTLKLSDVSFLQADAQLKSAIGHPNEAWRYHGLKSYLSGHYDEAIERFERAAGYADKFSQHYLSLIYWYGQGVPADRVQAYIWSDLAAERGGRRLLAIREKMWNQLDAAQRAEVEARGAAAYERYGDAAAQPRAEAALRRFAKQMTGSRVGYSNQNLDIVNGGPINGSFGNATPGMLAASAVAVGGSDEQQMYAEARTQSAAYWREQDKQLDARDVTVDVGPVSETRKPD
jgi:TPR repeat protein